MSDNIYFILLFILLPVLIGIKICKYYNKQIMFKKIEFDALSILK